MDEASKLDTLRLPLRGGGRVSPTLPLIKHFQFAAFRVSPHTACCFAEKARSFRLVGDGRRCAAASRFAFEKGKTL